MPSHAALDERPLTFTPETEVEKALKELKKKKADFAVVVDDKNIVQGVFTLAGIMKNLLPVSVSMADGIQLDVTVRAAPGIAKRLKKVYPLKVQDLMERKFSKIHPETPIWEAVHHLVNSPPPLVVIDSEKQKFIGVISLQSAMSELKRLQESET